MLLRALGEVEEASAFPGDSWNSQETRDIEHRHVSDVPQSAVNQTCVLECLFDYRPIEMYY